MFFKKLCLLFTLLLLTIVFANSVKLIEFQKQNIAKYEDSNWSFYASAMSGAGFYFWKNENDKYMFKYLNINTFLTSDILSSCCGGLEGVLSIEEVVKLKEIIDKMKKLKTSKPQVTTMIHALYLRTFIEKNGKDIKEYNIDFLKENREKILIDFFNFFNTFRGKKSTPCPSWESTIPIRNSETKMVECDTGSILPFIR